MENVLAIIPARGGSKGIPRKNVLNVAGHPLVAYTISHALNAKRISRVVVSTDDEDIARVARAYGAEVILRPDELAGDSATSESALVHVLDTLRDEEQYTPELVVFLQATSIFRLPSDLDAAVELIRDQDADSLFASSPQHCFMWRREESTGLRPFNYDHAHRPMRQNAPEDVMENGSFYIFKPEVLRHSGTRVGGKITIYPMPVVASFQVDEPGDIEIAEALVSVSGYRPPLPGLEKIKLLVLDFDGVLTDNSVQVDRDGRESVTCSRADSYGLSQLRQQTPVSVIIVSTETDGVVGARAKKLGIEFVSGCDDKMIAVQAIAKQRGYLQHEVAFVGNDLNDLRAMDWAGISFAVNDADPRVKRIAAGVTSRPGGFGAVREICDLITDCYGRTEST